MDWRVTVLAICDSLETRHKTHVDSATICTARHVAGEHAKIILAPRFFAPMCFIPDGDYDPYQHRPGKDYASYTKARSVPRPTPIVVGPGQVDVLLECVRDNPVHDAVGLSAHLARIGYRLDSSDNNNNRYIWNKEAAWFLGCRREDVGESIARIFSAHDPAVGVKRLRAYR